MKRYFSERIADCIENRNPRTIDEVEKIVAKLDGHRFGQEVRQRDITKLNWRENLTITENHQNQEIRPHIFGVKIMTTARRRSVVMHLLNESRWRKPPMKNRTMKGPTKTKMQTNCTSHRHRTIDYRGSRRRKRIGETEDKEVCAAKKHEYTYSTR